MGEWVSAYVPNNKDKLAKLFTGSTKSAEF